MTREEALAECTSALSQRGINALYDIATLKGAVYVERLWDQVLASGLRGESAVSFLELLAYELLIRRIT